MLGNREIFAENLKYEMDKKGVSASVVCADLNITKSTFSGWVNGKAYPRIDAIERLATYFCCLKSDLVDRQDHTKPELTLKDQVIFEIQRLTDEELLEMKRFARMLFYYRGAKDNKKESLPTNQ